MSYVRLICFATLLSCPFAAQAQVQWSLSTDIQSQYVAPTLGIVLHDRPVVQSSLTAAFANGCSVNLWGSKSFHGERGALDFGNEVDYTFGCGGAFDGWGWSASVSYFDLAPVFRAGNDLVQGALELNREMVFGDHTLTPYVAVKPVFPFASQGGAWFEGGFRHRWKIAEKFSFLQSLRAVYDTGALGNVPGTNLRYDAAFLWSVSKSVDVRLPTFQFFTPITAFGDGRKNEFLVGSGIDIRF